MPTLTYLGESHEVDHAAKGEDYIHGYDETGVMLISFEGITDFSKFTYTGEYMVPEHCASEVCNDVKFVAGRLQTRKGNPISTIVETTLTASGWSNGSYELEVEGVTDTSNQEILPGLEITEEQLTALQGANIQDGGQAAGSVTLKAFGDVPTIDIPIRVIVRGDM